MKVCLIKCIFGLHDFYDWYVPKGAFKSGHEIYCIKDCKNCKHSKQEWVKEYNLVAKGK